MPVPMQEAVDKEIRQHALKALQKAIFPPKIMSFELSTSAAASPPGPTPAPAPSANTSPPAAGRKKGARAGKGGGDGKGLLSAADGRPYGRAKKEGEEAMEAARTAIAVPVYVHKAATAADGDVGASSRPGRASERAGKKPSKAAAKAQASSCDSGEEEEEEEEEVSDVSDEEDGVGDYSGSVKDGDGESLAAGEVREETLGLTIARPKANGPVILSKVEPGHPAARSRMLQAGDELVEIGMQSVTRARLEVIGALLAWPPGLSRKNRLVQLSIHRGRSLLHVNIEQRNPDADLEPAAGAAGARAVGQLPPASVDGLKGGRGAKSADEAQSSEYGNMARISGPTNVQKRQSVTQDPRTGGLLGIPKEWQQHGVAPHDAIRFPTLGMEVHVGAFDGLTRIAGFKPSGPAEQTELLLIDDEVTHIDGQAIPVGIAAASARVRRMRELLGNAQRLVEITVKRTSACGAGQSSIAHVRVPAVAANLASSSDDDDWVVVDSDSDEPVDASRGPARRANPVINQAAPRDRRRGAGGKAAARTSKVGVGGGGGRSAARGGLGLTAGFDAGDFIDGLGGLVVDALESHI